jgi:hypothetical protein
MNLDYAEPNEDEEKKLYEEAKNKIRVKSYDGKMYLHHKVMKDGWYRTALFEVDEKKVGDRVDINVELWLVVEIAPGPFIDEDTFKNILEYDDKTFFTEPRREVRIIYNKKINDGKLFHEIFEYDNGYIVDTWVEIIGQNKHKYIAEIKQDRLEFNKRIESEIDEEMKKDMLGLQVRDQWDIGALFVRVEDIMTEEYLKQQNGITNEPEIPSELKGPDFNFEV